MPGSQFRVTCTPTNFLLCMCPNCPSVLPQEWEEGEFDDDEDEDWEDDDEAEGEQEDKDTPSKPSSTGGKGPVKA